MTHGETASQLLSIDKKLIRTSGQCLSSFSDCATIVGSVDNREVFIRNDMSLIN